MGKRNENFRKLTSIFMTILILSTGFLFTSCTKKNPPHIDDMTYMNRKVEMVEQLAGYRLLKKHFFSSSGTEYYYFEMEKISDINAPLRIVGVTEQIYCSRKAKEGYEFRIPFLVEDVSILNGYTVIGKWSNEVSVNKLAGKEMRYYLKLKKDDEIRDVQVLQVIFEKVEMGTTFPLPAEKEEKEEQKKSQ